MIEILDKKDCCGCSACVQRCPKQCISMQEDEEGFLYPQVDIDRCINCGLCEKVCPVINQNEPREPFHVYAAKNPDEKIRMESSSGGIFTMIAEKIIDEGGVVFGVGFNEHWEAAHSYTETKEGLAAFRMSKYVQSIVGNTFKEAEDFLKQGRKVLYTGTPCQIAGLKKFLRKDYDNLLTLDFICHGTPSPGVFRWYLAEELVRLARKSGKKYSFALRPIPLIPKADALAAECGYEIKGICFRDKKHGWKKYSFALDLSEASADGEKNSVSLSYTLDKNAFLRGFLKDLYLRPSCHHCPTKELKSSSDITIGDYWGIWNLNPELFDDKGVSAIMLNTEKSIKYFDSFRGISVKMDFENLCKYNSAVRKSSLITQRRLVFYSSYDSFFKRISKLCDISLKTKILNRLRKIVKLLLIHHR